MRVLIKPRTLTGELTAPPAKADAHRKLICAALADKPTYIYPSPVGNDVAATVDCLRQLGASLQADDSGLLIKPLTNSARSPLLNCRESGASLRFLLPVTAMLTETSAFIGAGRLPNRPIKELISALTENGVSFSAAKLPFCISGRFRGGLFRIPGHISSQYISGLLFALPLAQEDSEIYLTTPLQAPGYVQMTLNTLTSFGIKIRSEGDHFYIAGRQKYRSPGHVMLEGDWSNAAFFLSAGALAGPVRINRLKATSCQPDKAILPLLIAFGAQVKQQEDTVTVCRGSLSGQEIDIAAITDLAPVLAVLGAFADGRTVLKNAARLRYKESDRLQSISALLSSLGAQVVENKDSIIIQKQGQLNGGEIHAQGDHRLVMAAAVAACGSRQDVIISGSESVNKSYPDFFTDYRTLGGYAVNVRRA